MKSVTTDITLEVDGRVYGPFQTHQRVHYLEPFNATMPTGVSYVGLDSVLGRVATGTITLLVLFTSQAISVRVNNLVSYEKAIAAGGIYCLANYAGVLTQPPDIQNNSGQTATIVGVVGGLL